MSYILDALQRAEQERQRKSGAVPGLQTRALSVPMEARGDSKILVGRWAIAGLVLASVVAIATAVALWRTTPADAPATTKTPVVVLAAPAPATAPVASALPTATPPLPRKNPLPMPPEQAKPLVRDPINAASDTTGVAAPSAAPAKIASATFTLPFLKDMPEDFRRQVPTLAISGVVYSENPAQRLLLVNGQVLAQGSRVAADLTLDEIQSKASHFTFRGTRFKLSH